MKKIRITVMRMACYKDLMEQYENPIEHACDMKLGQVSSPTDGKSPRDCARVPGKACLPS